jgi:hypothetical protein
VGDDIATPAGYEGCEAAGHHVAAGDDDHGRDNGAAHDDDGINPVHDSRDDVAFPQLCRHTDNLSFTVDDPRPRVGG